MQMMCECGEEISGDICMLCGREVTPDMVQRPVDNRADLPHDDTRLGMLGDHKLDITGSVHIMDREGNTIYDIPYEEAECSMRFGALSIRHTGRRVSMRGRDARAWLRAIQYMQAPPVWYMRGSDECEMVYAGKVLGVTPCVLIPPFSWQAFKNGSYRIMVRRPGTKEQTRTIPAVSGIHTIRCREGTPPVRAGSKPEGDILVLNPERSLVMADQPYLTDGQGVAILMMPGAEARVGMMKRKATIAWNQPGLGSISVDVKCDSPLKYERLQELLPQKKEKEKEGEASAPVEVRSASQPYTELQPMGSAQYGNALPAAPKKKSRWGREKKWNRGNYNGTDLCVTKTDLETRMGRFDGYTFEAVCANLLASMDYHIVKGYDVKSGHMLGTITSDRGVDIIAKKGKDRIIVQCKLWQEQCGGPDVNKTLGAATTEKGTSILMIASGGFTSQAKQIARESSMEVDLWDWDVIRRNIRKHLM